MVQKAAILVGIATIGIAVAVVALVVEGKLPLLMGRSRDSNENGKGSASEENGLTCRIERTLMSLENGGDDETFECTVVSAGREDILKEMSYPIELPLALVLENKKAMDEGNLYVFIPGGYVNEKYIEGIGTMGIDIYVPDGADIRILNNKQASALRRPTRNNNHRKRSLYAKGVRSVMVFRISTDDGSPDVDSNEIEKRLYSSEEFSFAHQFEECSFGQLRFQPVDYRTPVNELYLPGETASFTERSILNAAMRVATNIHGSEIWDNLDHAIFCMPEGTQGKPYIAYSGVGSYFSVFHNTRCAYPTTVMHEIAHNLGLGHAFEKGEEYADETSVMGFSSSSREGPRKCFNGQNIWQFGWFNDRRTSVDPFQGTQLIELAPFVDYDHTYSNQVVLVSVFDIHIVYNRAKSFNAETSEYPNTATITQELNQINSELLGVLDMNQPVFKIENFMETGRTLHIQVCETYTSSTSTSPDFMLLSIGLDGPMCPNTPSPTSKTTPAPQTPSPTDATWAPTLNPTRAPSPAPTVKLPMIVLNTPSPDDLSRDTPSPSIGTPEKDVFIPENDVVMFTDPPKKPNLYDKPQISQEDPTPSPTASQDDIATPSQSMSQDDIDEDNESRNEGDFNGAKNAFNPEGETLAMIFCAASLALFTICCMLAVFRWNQRRLDEQKRNLRILEYSASSQVKLYMQDPV